MILTSFERSKLASQMDPMTEGDVELMRREILRESARIEGFHAPWLFLATGILRSFLGIYRPGPATGAPLSTKISYEIRVS